MINEEDIIFNEANNIVIEKVKSKELSLNKDEELLISWLIVNLSKSPKILSVLECWATLLYKDDMEREYINQFINRIREVSNSQKNEW